MRIQRLLIALLSVLSLACGGGNDDDDPSEERLNAVVDITRQRCAPCHTTQNLARHRVGTAGEVRAMIDLPSLAAPQFVLVKPGDAEESYIIMKLVDAPGIVGEAMPKDAFPMPTEEIEVIRDWIDRLPIE